MKRRSLNWIAALLAGAMLPALALATPEEDRAMFRKFYQERFPDMPIEEYVNGVYGMDSALRANWEAIEDFPPYEPFIEAGKALWEKPFANGKGFRECFPDGPAIQSKYPRWNKETGMVETLSGAIQECLKANGEKPYKYMNGPLAEVLSYMAFESRGQIVNVVVPADDPRALAAYEDGRKFYFTKRGQLNFSCANCHIQNAGKNLRSELLSPTLGHATHWPVYRSKWTDIATLHRRFDGCNDQVRAKPFEQEGPEYRNLEYFLTYISNGLPLNGPAARQ